MAITDPRYNITTPSESTLFKNLGKELREMGTSISDALELFDYNGADPNLILSQLSATQLQITALQSLTAQLADKMKESAWVDVKALISAGAAWATAGHPLQIKRVGNRVHLRGRLLNNTAYTSYTLLGTLPLGWRPAAGTATFLLSGGNTTISKSVRISTVGKFECYSSAASTSWFFDGISWETDDAWQPGQAV